MDIRDDFKKGMYYMGRALLGFMATRELLQKARDKYEEYTDDDNDYDQDYSDDRNWHRRRKSWGWLRIAIPIGLYFAWKMLKKNKKKRRGGDEEDDED